MSSDQSQGRTLERVSPKTLVSRGLARLGFELHRVGPFSTPRTSRFGYDLEEQARRHIDVVRAHTMVSYAGLVTLHEQVAHCERASLPGCFVECGTWKGGAVGLIALGNQLYGSHPRHLHLFDSFQGLPEPDEMVDGDDAVQLARRANAGVRGRLVPVRDDFVSLGTLEDNRRLLEETIGYDRDHLHYHQGWFQDVVPVEAPGLGDIALLRLDGDWYHSTKVCLEHLYPNVVPGGFVVIDDYGTYEGCRRATEEFLDQQERRPFLHRIDRYGRYWIRP